MDDSVPRSKRLLTDARSNIFVYVTGHGGNEFLKFQDNEEISAFDVADAFEQMWQKKRHANFFFICLTTLILLLGADTTNCFSWSTRVRQTPCTQKYTRRTSWQPVHPNLEKTRTQFV